MRKLELFLGYYKPVPPYTVYSRVLDGKTEGVIVVELESRFERTLHLYSTCFHAPCGEFDKTEADLRDWLHETSEGEELVEIETLLAPLAIDYESAEMHYQEWLALRCDDFYQEKAVDHLFRAAYFFGVLPDGRRESWVYGLSVRPSMRRGICEKVSAKLGREV